MDWQKVEDELRLLASKVSQKPHAVVGIVRGGLIPARLLAKYLYVDDMYALTVKKQGLERVVTSEINEGLHGKSVLLVEDALETGASMNVAREYLVSIGASVETAALYYLPQSKVIPDCFIARIETLPLFPWD